MGNDVTSIQETSHELTTPPHAPPLAYPTWTSAGVTQGTPEPDGTTTASIPVTPGSQFRRLSVSR